MGFDVLTTNTSPLDPVNKLKKFFHVDKVLFRFAWYSACVVYTSLYSENNYSPQTR